MTDNSNYPSGSYNPDLDERDESFGCCVYTSDDLDEDTENDI